MDKAKVIFEKLAIIARTRQLLKWEKEMPSVFKSFYNKDGIDRALVNKKRLGRKAGEIINEIPKVDKISGKYMESMAKDLIQDGKGMQQKIKLWKNRN